MGDVASIPTGAVEPILVQVVGADGAGLSGLANVEVRMFRASDGQFFDWDDDTFKGAGHVQLEQALSEVDATNAPGWYELASASHPNGLNTGLAGFDTADEIYLILPVRVAGRFAPARLEVRSGKWVDEIDLPIDGYTTKQHRALAAAALYGRVSDGPASPKFEDADQTAATRIDATADANGNRTAITLTPPPA